MMRGREQGFPVVDGDRVVGMVCLEDLQRAPVPPGARVADVMRRHVHTIRPESPAVDAMQRMSRNGYPRLLVVDISGLLVGTVTEADLLGAIRKRTTGLDWGVHDGNGAPQQVVLPREPSVTARG